MAQQPWVGPVMWALLRHSATLQMAGDPEFVTAAGASSRVGVDAAPVDATPTESDATSGVGNGAADMWQEPRNGDGDSGNSDFDLENDDFALPPPAIDVHQELEHGEFGIAEAVIWDGGSDGWDIMDYASTAFELGSYIGSDLATTTRSATPDLSIASAICPTDDLRSMLASPGATSPTFGYSSNHAFGLSSPPTMPSSLEQLHQYAFAEDKKLSKDTAILALLLQAWRRRAEAASRVPRSTPVAEPPAIKRCRTTVEGTSALGASAECAHRVGGRRVAFRSSRQRAMPPNTRSETRSAPSSARRAQQQATCSGRQTHARREATSVPSCCTRRTSVPSCCTRRVSQRPTRGILN